jgi:hypothetical protein
MPATADRVSTPKGKIACLPFEIREELCRRMRDGARGPALIKWLAEAAPQAGTVNAQNLTNWRQNGYRAWLAGQARVDAIRDRTETVRRELEAGGFSVLDQQIYELAGAMTDSDPVKAARAIAALKLATVAEKRAEIAGRNANLAERKFQRQTCELFQKWHADQRAIDVVENPGLSADQKTDMLGQIMFGEDWK